jgi:hypothetical protein
MYRELAARWRSERLMLVTPKLLLGLSMLSLFAGVIFLTIPARHMSTLLVGGIVGGIWLLTLAVAAAIWLRRPDPKRVALRADRVLDLADDLLSLNELPPDAPWTAPNRAAAESALDSKSIISRWPLRFAPRSGMSALLALVISAGSLWIGVTRANSSMRENARLSAARDERIREADPVFEDWKEFVEQSDDPELKKLFTEAQKIREAMKELDPMEAMKEMNAVQEKIASLQESLDAQSLAAQSDAVAEALESFDGLGELSAALRKQDFQAAAEAAAKQADAAEKSPEAKLDVKRADATSEMLATQANTAQNRGNDQLSDSLNQLSKLASNRDAKRGDLKNPLKKLSSQLDLECKRKQCNSLAKLGRDQIEQLKRQMRGEECTSECLSLCQSLSEMQKPGGSKAGTQAGGDPIGDETKLANAAFTESAPAGMGEGESEITVQSSANGSGAAAGPERATSFSAYDELSRKAVTDESLPLAHRSVIRKYFERIRPIAGSKTP